MDRSSPDDSVLIETLKDLIISRKGSVALSQLQGDYEQMEGRKLPELKMKSLLKYNNVFHCIKPVNGQEERWDVRFDVKARMNRNQKPPQKKFNPAMIPRTMKNPVVRNRSWTFSINNSINNNNNYQQNLNVTDMEPMSLTDMRQRTINKDPAPLMKLTMPLSERLKKRGELSPQDIIAAKVVQMPESWDKTPGTSYDKLIQYCQLNKIQPPELKFLKTPFAKNTFRCQVTVRDKTFMAYNDSFPTENEAQEASCRVAVKEIQREEQLSKHPLDVSSDFEIVRRIWTMIRTSIGGVFIKHIAELYIDTYSLSPPENWHQLVKQYNGKLFTFEINILNKEPVMFATGDVESFDGCLISNSHSIQHIPELKFPWEEKLWNVFVTSAFSTNDICARLIGSEYSGALDKLMTEIEMAMMNDKNQRPTEIECGLVYLTSIAECWHRIKVVEINGNQANCVCIDNGDIEWITINEIFECPPEFLTIAPQAFKLSLFGLEDFENDPNVAQQPLFEPLVFKSLVGEIMMEKKTWSNNKLQPIKMILYDTSTDEDINLNETLMSSILKSIPTPLLSQKDNNQVIVTHIGDDGIYCQMVKSWTYMQQLINNLPKTDLAKHNGLYMDKADKKRIYLIYDPKSKAWFRARMERFMDGDQQLMYYVDYGIKTMIKVNDIYRLDKLSFILYFYPPQALKFGLFNVQLTDDVKKRLMALLPSGRQALVKFVTTGTGNIPLVYLFTHISHNEETIMIKINDQFTSFLGTELQSFSPNEPLIQLEQRQLKNDGKFMKVHVSLVSSPRGFVILLEDDLAQYEEMLKKLQIHCVNSRKLAFTDIKKSECYAIYDEDSRKWIRGSAENVMDQNFIHCLCVDSGNFKTLSLDKMRTLPNEFRKIPKLAMKARLYGVKPKYKDFTPDDAIYFQKLTENKNFPAVIKNISIDPFEKQAVYEIVLFGKDDKIHELLIKNGRAVAN